MKILIADDSAPTRLELRKYLDAWGYDVVEAEDGDAAMHMLRSMDPPRIALLDWMMPGLEGPEICCRLAADPGSELIYTLLLTSKNAEQDIVTALNQGAHDFISKPLSPAELRSRIGVGQRLVESDRMKNKVLGVVAHDLRNPLSSISGFAQYLLDEPEGLSDDQMESLETIVEAGSGMLDMLNDLLDLSEIRSGRLVLLLNPTDIKQLVEKRVRLIMPHATRKDIALQATLDPVPPVVLDSRRIAQVVDNLLSNAVKFSPSDTTVQVGLSVEGEELLFEVSDQGPGISPSDREKLFGEFQSLSARPTGGEKSTGLGLAIVRQIVEAHQGQIDVTSTPGDGATFQVRIPIP